MSEQVSLPGWLWKVVVPILVATVLCTASMLSSHQVRLGQHDTRLDAQSREIDGVQSKLTRIEDKIDRILQRN